MSQEPAKGAPVPSQLFQQPGWRIPTSSQLRQPVSTPQIYPIRGQGLGTYGAGHQAMQTPLAASTVLRTQQPVWAQQLRPGNSLEDSAAGVSSQMHATPATSALTHQYRGLVNTSRPNFVPQQHIQYLPVPHLSEEDRKVIPQKSLKRKAMTATGNDNAEMDAELEAAIVQIADDFITSSVAFGCGLARQKKAKKLEATDVAAFLENNWQINIPGYSEAQVRPYKRPAAKEIHQARLTSVRKEIASALETDSLAGRGARIP